jgi:hypothetical protein
MRLAPFLVVLTVALAAGCGVGADGPGPGPVGVAAQSPPAPGETPAAEPTPAPGETPAAEPTPPPPSPVPTPHVPGAGYADAVFGHPSIPFRTLVQTHNDAAHGGRIGIDLLPATSVIRSEEDVAAFLKAHPLGWAHDGSGRKLERTLPALDYAQEQGVSIILPAQSTGAIRCEIVAIEAQPDRYLVHTVRWLPPDDAVLTADMGWPWHYVAIPRADKPIAFAPVVDVQWTWERPWPFPSSQTIPFL